MSSSDDAGGKKVSRRRFLGWAGALTAVGAIGVWAGHAADVALGDKTPTPSPTSPGSAKSGASAPSAAATSTQSTANSFSVFWITDTQFLSESNPALFKMMTNWIVDNWSRYNGKLVIHTGDLVQTGAHQAEWKNADEAMSVLLNNGIPYTWCAGNHDDLVQDAADSGWMGDQWTTAFNPSLVKARVQYHLPGYSWVGDYHDGMDTAVTFAANGHDFLVVNVEWNGDSSVLAWVSSVLEDPQYADYHVIVASHAYIDAWGSLNDPRWGEEIDGFVNGLRALLDEHSSNVFLTLNGHFATDQGYNTPTPVNNRNELMFDRQDCTDDPGEATGRGIDDTDSSTPDSEKVGGAVVTILTFDIDVNQIAVKTYDVYTGQWRSDPNDQYSVIMFPKPQATLAR